MLCYQTSSKLRFSSAPLLGRGRSGPPGEALPASSTLPVPRSRGRPWVPRALPPAVCGRCEEAPGSSGARPWAWPPGAPPDAAAAPLRPFRLPRRRRRRFRAGDGEAAGAAAAAGGREGAREPLPSRGRALRHRHLALVGEPGPGGDRGAPLRCAPAPAPAFPFPAAAARGVWAPGGGEEGPAVLCALRGERGRVRRGWGTARCAGLAGGSWRSAVGLRCGSAARGGGVLRACSQHEFSGALLWGSCCCRSALFSSQKYAGKGAARSWSCSRSGSVVASPRTEPQHCCPRGRLGSLSHCRCSMMIT